MLSCIVYSAEIFRRQYRGRTALWYWRLQYVPAYDLRKRKGKRDELYLI